MMRALYTAASGMISQQYNIDTISNNLANVNSTGFRKNLARFQDLMYQTLRAPGSPSDRRSFRSDKTSVSASKVASSEKIFTQGSLQQTSNPLDIAIEGDGFFQVTLPDGTTAYTRDGGFKEDATGAVVTADGYFLSPQITIPQNAIQVSVGHDGTVTALTPGATTPTTLGQITLVRFTNAAGLQPMGKNLFQQTGASGTPIISQPGLNGAGTLEGGYIEESNVSIVNEMVNMIVAQNAYQANSKTITTAENMLATAIQTKQ